MNLHHDLLAKLLASENIDIIRENVKTASFDIIKRVLSIPMWQDMNDDIEMMLIAHETGHAIYSPIEMLNDKTAPHSYKNVIEDVRIERKIKNLFPGLRKDFSLGYKELNDRDFFGVNNRDLSTAMLIDKINLYFKVGFNCGVTFNSEEKVFIDRAETCDTYQDVIALSLDIYNYSKDQKDYRDENSKDFEESNEDGEKYEYFDDGDLEEDEGNDDFEGEVAGNTDSQLQDEFDPELESKTQEKFDSKLDELADTNTQIINHNTDLIADSQCPIVNYKTILETLQVEYTNPDYHYYVGDDNSQEFKRSSLNYVNYLVKEFEMKKAATRYSRTTTARTGTLNVNKLHAYQLTDDIFKSISVVKDDNNHGMIFLLDWSGSMTNVMEDTVKQVINLVMFCQRANIKFQVLAFTSNYDYSINTTIQNSTMSNDNYNLLELFTNNMTNSESNRMIKMLLSKPWRYSRKFQLGNTPLNAALLYMLDYIGAYSIKNNVEKASLVILTDGLSNKLYFDVKIAEDFRRNCIHKLWDSKKKKSYSFSTDSKAQTDTLLNIIKDRYQIPIIGFFVTDTSKRSIYRFIYDNLSGFNYDLFDIIKSAMRKDGVYVSHSTAYDELYVIPSSKIVDNVELAVTESMTNAKIKSSFIKYLDQGKKSRVILNKFISQIC